MPAQQQKYTECSTHIVACQQGRMSIKCKRLTKNFSQTLLTNILFSNQNLHSYFIKDNVILNDGLPKDTFVAFIIGNALSSNTPNLLN